MAKINADPDLLESVARELTGIAEDMDAQGRTLANAGNQTAAVWNSRYTGQYLESVNRTKSKVASSAGNIRATASALRRAASEIRRVEREIQQKTKGSK